MAAPQEIFPCLNETDVRETIIRPLLSRLGYSGLMVATEVSLTYQFLFFGRKKGPTKDRPLKGRIDYILDVDDRTRWIIEAKSPGEISDNDREQAYTYAIHPEVRAVVFAVISGTHFEIFHTHNKPETGPILKFEYSQLESSFQSLFNIVSPKALRHLRDQFVIDTGRPLSPDLHSSAIVENGTLKYTECPSFSENIVGIVVHISEGFVVRNAQNEIEAHIKPSFHHEALGAFSLAIKSTWVEFSTTDEEISVDPNNPTIFRHEKILEIKKGTTVPSFVSVNTSFNAPQTMSMFAVVIVTGYLKGTTFFGKLVAGPLMNGTDFAFHVRADLKLKLR